MGVERTFSFTSWANDHPSDRLPGDRIDAVFADHARAIKALETRVSRLLGEDGKLGSNLLVRASFPLALRQDFIATATTEGPAVAAAEAVLVEIAARQRIVAGWLAEATAGITRLEQAVTACRLLVTALVMASVELVSRLTILAGEAETVLAAARGATTMTARLATSAADWAAVSAAWAEHMPDSIPADVVALAGLTGDHWSSLWWANQTAAAP